MTAERESGGDVDIDARGLKCPWPALRLARTMRSNDQVTVVADDPMAASEFAALATENGWQIDKVSTRIGDGWRISR